MKQFQMSKTQSAHVKRLINETSTRMYEKYKFGCENHAIDDPGGLLDVSLLVLINYAIDEAIDQLSYLLTAKEKLEAADRAVQTAAAPGNAALKTARDARALGSGGY